MKKLTGILLLVVLAAVAALLLFEATPKPVSRRDPADVIIVLGCPAYEDGTISPGQRERTLAGVREYRDHIAPRIIFTGGAARNAFVESHVMATLAIDQGVPAADVLEEDRAINTVQNAQYSLQIMQAHGWHSADVIASPSQIRRANLIFQKLPIDFEMNAAPWPREFGLWIKLLDYAGEVPRTDLCRVGICGHDRLLRLIHGSPGHRWLGPGVPAT